MSRPLSSDSPLTSKGLLIDRIKQNFDLETQICRQQEQNTANEGHTDHINASQVQNQLRRLKRRCAKLERKLQEKEKEIQSLQDQQHLRFPLLMHETIRSLRSLEDNQSDVTANASPLSHSVISGMAHEKRDLDARIHEYEKQIAALYEENQQEKLKNDMLSECLENQKHSKAKLMKACKHIKQELQALKDSGLSQMLVDIEARCNTLEKEKARVVEELEEERSLRVQQESQHKCLSKQLEDMAFESAKWEDIVSRKTEKLLESRDQICEQQLMIENLKEDLKILEQRIERTPELCRDDDQEEIKQLKSIISKQRTKDVEVQRDIQQLRVENGFLREQLVTQNEEGLFHDGVSSCASHETYDKVLIQVRFIKRRLLALKELVQTYDETNTVNINLLDEQDSFHEDCMQDDTDAARSCEWYAMQLSGNALDAARILSELQQVVEDACARLMGSTCALQ